MTASSDFRVCVDGFNLALPRGTGIATYARTLTYALKALGFQVDVLYGMNISKEMPPELREVIFFDSIGQEEKWRRGKFPSARWWKATIADFRGHTAIDIPITGRVERRGFDERLPAANRILNIPGLYRRAIGHFKTTGRFLDITIPNTPRIMHWTYPLPIRVNNSLNIYTIHDVVPLRFPSTTLDDKNYHYKLIECLTKQADALCTVSEAARTDILSFFPSAKKKLYNAYQSFQPNQTALSRELAETEKEIRGAFALEPQSYYIFCGSIEPKKNIGRLIESFLAADTSRKLVLVGAMAWKNEQELRFLQRGLDLGRIISIDYLPQAMLHALIRNARGMLFPSLTEGFGLPVLEAMAFGTPVLTSAEGSLPEVVEDAAIVVDAYDTASIMTGIERLDKDEDLYERLRLAGPEQAQKFSMARYQERLTEMYRNILNSNVRARD
ncbi:glycosyltransferase family 1 protein [Kozakia baliensis]|uniref:glycosyltransferase family 4 protein n=1 Tax=Kozakia baliensis TaxID=153496 RepID=UPI00345BC330